MTDVGYLVFRTCLHKKCVRIFEHNFVADKAKIRRRAVARQEFLTQSAAKFAEKTCAYACEDGFLNAGGLKPRAVPSGTSILVSAVILSTN